LKNGGEIVELLNWRIVNDGALATSHSKNGSHVGAVKVPDTASQMA